MAKLFSQSPLVRVAGAILLLTTLSACVGPHHRGQYGGGGYGRSYAYQQPVYRGGYNPGWQGGHQRGWR
ncbi:hypothetical protein [Sediminicoccus sp. KRV36]|uniref:hypothetical protein n=1 Tax=Sediminicoccus sp. KRV36 TaxID=3133721 RepID=UPI00200EC022|nr:hypothetical protein [Sediminicoccus rosea]UPY35920.1 hypothetical protein LHU95_17090 [Sediminicoccus rosea]